MPILFKDYIDLILKAYEEKRKTDQLPSLLAYPTTANIKQECLNVYNERVKKGERVEENTLRAFFGVPPEGRNFGYSIEKSKPDKFRPLQSLIKGDVKKPALPNVELLAWLIDFTPRPLAVAKNKLGNASEVVPEPDWEQNETGEMILTQSNVSTTAGLPGSSEASVLEKVNEEKPSGKKNHKRIIIIFLTGVISLGAGYMAWQKIDSTKMSWGNANTGCMYWADNHYQQVPCNEEVKGRFVLPMNVEKMRNFKRIMKEDTITERSIGKVHYIKRNGAVEFYTAGGNHPVEPSRSLKPLSAYMYKTYLQKESIPNKDSVSGEALNHINNR